MDESYLLKTQNSVKLKKLNKRFGSINKYFVGESNKINGVGRANIEHLSNKKSKDKLENIYRACE